MSTITPMTDDTNESSGTSSGTGEPAASSTADKPGPDAAGPGPDPDKPGPDPGEHLPATPAQHGPQTTRAAEQRSALVPVLSTIVGTLIVGAFSLAAIGFNVLRTDTSEGFAQVHAETSQLRTDMNERFAQVDARFSELRTDMNERFAQVDARFAQIDQRFAQMDATLLDHTDRLARIETAHHIRPHPAPQP